MSSLLDGFFGGFKWRTNKTKKQIMEERIKDSVLNLVIDRDQSFLKTARGLNTSIIVNNREGGIQEFSYENRRYISFPSGMADEFEGLEEWQAEEKMDALLKIATTSNEFQYEEGRISEKLNDCIKKYKEDTGLDSGYETPTDMDGNVISPFQFRAGKEKEDKEDAEESGEDGKSGGMKLSNKGVDGGSSESHEQNVKFTGSTKAREYSFEDTDLDIGGSLPEEARDNPFFDSSEGCGEYDEIDKHREEVLKRLATNIVKSFKGRISKQRTMIPSKRLVSKSLTIDTTEKIYENKKGDNGKHLKINLIIDMSGSMSGTQVKNALEMIYIFNEIASKGYLTGNVMWSESRTRCSAKFPMPREFILNMRRTGGGEGLGKNLKHFIKELKEADANICMTDGQLTDDPILKSMYAKEKIDIIGVYVNKNAKDLTEYTGSLSRWFTRSLVRHTTEELCEKLIQFSLRKKK